MRDRIRLVLATLDAKQAELLLLRGNDLSYGEVAAALDLNPSSVGTLLSRAQAALELELGVVGSDGFRVGCPRPMLAAAASDSNVNYKESGSPQAPVTIEI